ncbi:hypothetical protein [Aminobacter ciceronei]|uniref:hypothetical protein n=1 Tax=Aminobacter ciceronei TaxID=150723 RepID=UPI003F6F39E7
MLAGAADFGAAAAFAAFGAAALAGAGLAAVALAAGLVSGLVVSAGLAAALVVADFAVLALPVDLANASSLVVLVSGGNDPPAFALVHVAAPQEQCRVGACCSCLYCHLTLTASITQRHLAERILGFAVMSARPSNSAAIAIRRDDKTCRRRI